MAESIVSSLDDDDNKNSDVTLRARDNVEITMPSTCLEQSQFLQALQFEGDERVLSVPNIPSIYLRFAVQYLRATCQGYDIEEPMTEAQEALLTVRNVVFYPELLRYLYGYLGITSFKDFYQQMLLAAVDEGAMNSNIASHLERRSLDLLSEEQLFAVSEFQPAVINAMYRVPNARAYLRLKLQRDTLALSGRVVLEVRNGKLFVNERYVATTGYVQSVHTLTETESEIQRYYYYLMDREVWKGEIIGTEVLPAERDENVMERLLSLSVGRRWLAGVLENGNLLVADGDQYPEFPETEHEVEGLREVVASPFDERVIVLLTEGRVALYGEVEFLEESPLSLFEQGEEQENDLRLLTTVPRSIRMVAPDEGLLLTEKLHAFNESATSALMRRKRNPQPLADTYGLGPLGITFNARFEALYKGEVLERGVTAIGYDSYARRLVFRALNGALRYWQVPSDRPWTREYQRRR